MAGPRVISKPSGAIDVVPGASIQVAINGASGTSTLWLLAGVHSINASITPKTGITIVGQFGAIIDGSGWSTTDGNDAAFKSIGTTDVRNVTISNLEIRNMPKNGIKVYDFGNASPSAWTVNYCYVHHCALNNLAIGRNGLVEHNILSYGGDGGAVGGNYSAFRGDGAQFNNNEISFGSNEQKIVAANNVKFHNNWVHDQRDGVGIWFDSDCANALIEYNIVDDNPYDGIMYEACMTGIIRYNVVRRNGFSGGSAIFVSTSKQCEVYNNTLENNFRGIQYFVNCSAVGLGGISYDLADNYSHHNTISTSSGSLANMLSYASGCANPVPYTSNTKNNNFNFNSYFVPNSASGFWVWGLATFKNWTEWQALPQDVNGSVALLSSYTPSTAVWIEESENVTTLASTFKPLQSNINANLQSNVQLASTFRILNSQLIGSAELTGQFSSTFPIFNDQLLGQNESIGQFSSIFSILGSNLNVQGSSDGIINTLFFSFQVAFSSQLESGAVTSSTFGILQSNLNGSVESVAQLDSTFVVPQVNINANNELATVISSTFFPIQSTINANSEILGDLNSTFGILQSGLNANSQLTAQLTSSLKILQDEIQANSQLTTTFASTFSLLTVEMTGTVSDVAFASTFGILQSDIQANTENAGILTSAFFPIIDALTGTIGGSTIGAGIYYLKKNQRNDRYYSSISPLIEIDTNIDSNLTTGTIHDDEENILHVGGFSIRVVGDLPLHPILYDLDSVDNQILDDIILTETNEFEPFKLANFKSQRTKLKLYNDQMSAYFDITRIVLYVKKLWTDYSR